MYKPQNWKWRTKRQKQSEETPVHSYLTAHFFKNLPSLQRQDHRQRHRSPFYNNEVERWQKAAIFILTAVRTSNETFKLRLYSHFVVVPFVFFQIQAEISLPYTYLRGVPCVATATLSSSTARSFTDQCFCSYTVLSQRLPLLKLHTRYGRPKGNADSVSAFL
jgi:hypothetical protein